MTDRAEKLEKAMRKNHPEFVEAMENAALESLEKNLAIMAKHREEILVAQKEDEALNDAKAEVAVLNGPYSDGIKASKMKMAYLNNLIDEKKI